MFQRNIGRELYGTREKNDYKLRRIELVGNGFVSIETQLPTQVSFEIMMINDVGIRFKATEVKEIIKDVVTNRLKGKEYQMEQVQQWTKDICNEVQDKCMELKYERYKFIINVMIGEQRGEGVK